MLAGPIDERLGLAGKANGIVKTQLEREAHAEMIRHSFYRKSGWNTKLWRDMLEKLAVSVWLTKKVRKGLAKPKKGGRFTQEVRFYWHALDNFADNCAKSLRSSFVKAQAQMARRGEAVVLPHSAPMPSSKKRARGDEEEEEEEEKEDSPSPKKKAKKGKAKSKVREEEEEDDDELPPPREKLRRVKSKPKKTSTPLKDAADDIFGPSRPNSRPSSKPRESEKAPEMAEDGEGEGTGTLPTKGFMQRLLFLGGQ